MPRAALILDVRLAGATGDVYVNDVPLGRVHREAGAGLLQANHVLVSGTNRFEVLLHPGETPSVARTARRTLQVEGLWAQVRAAQCPPGSAPGDPDARELFEFRSTVPAGALEVPHVVEYAFDLDLPFGPWAWERAPRLILDAACRADAARFVRSLHEALSRRRFDDFWAHNEVTHAEVASAYGLSLSERRSAAEAALAERFRDPAFAMAPIVEEEFDFRLVAGGRLVECVARDGAPIVRTCADAHGHTMRFPIMIGRVDGRMRGLR